MYKTIKHGDNSLQYTILPQEEGTANVRAKKSRNRGKTAAIITITVVLVCGIIATAIIVPLLLTSDLVVLPAAFQKFSVSSLRKSHSGNHVVVLAKKPHGWTGHHSLVHTLSNNKTHGGNKKAYKSQEETLNGPVNSTVTAATTLTTKITEATTERPKTIMSNEREANKVEDNKGAEEKNVLRVYETNKYTEIPMGRNYLDISTTTRSSKGNEFLEDKVVRLSNTEIQTTSSPWYQSKWSFGHSYMTWMGNDAADNLMNIIAGSSAVILCVVVIFFVWMRRRRNLRNNEIKKSTDAKADDKDTLLKESAAGSEEE